MNASDTRDEEAFDVLAPLDLLFQVTRHDPAAFGGGQQQDMMECLQLLLSKCVPTSVCDSGAPNNHGGIIFASVPADLCSAECKKTVTVNALLQTVLSSSGCQPQRASDVLLLHMDPRLATAVVDWQTWNSQLEVAAAKYQVSGFVHFQPSSEGSNGHYVAYVRRDKHWYEANDSVVKDCSGSMPACFPYLVVLEKTGRKRRHVESALAPAAPVQLALTRSAAPQETPHPALQLVSRCLNTAFSQLYHAAGQKRPAEHSRAPASAQKKLGRFA